MSTTIDLSREVSSWPVENEWSISPGTPWCKKGSRLKVGKDCTIMSSCTIGSGCIIGSDCIIMSKCTIRPGCFIGSGCDIESGCDIGHGATLHKDHTYIATLGYADGYTKTLSSMDGVAYISAGCRHFTMDEAITHWTNHGDDRSMTLCLLESAKALADMNGLL